jgi:MFS family permease
MAIVLPCVVQFVLVLDLTIVAIALPAMQADLALSTTALGWVVTAYTLVFGVCLIPGGRLADLVGRRRVFMGGLVLFAVASLACGLAQSGATLLAARAVQGLGAALASPAALALLTAAGRGARALGWWTAAAAGGGAGGWALGGVLTELLDWRSVFLVNLPLCAAAVALAPLVLREQRECAARAPLHRVLLSHPRVAGPNAVAFVLTAATTPPMFLCTLHAQNVLDLDPGAAGLLFPPFNLAVVAGSLAGPRVVAAAGERRAMASGLIAVAAGALALLAIAPDAPALPSLLAGFVLLGAGLGVASVASTLRGTAALDAADQGLASGLLATSAQVGTALGLAVVVPVTAARTGSLGGGDDDAQVAGFELGFVLAAALAAATALAIELRGSAAVDRLVGRRLGVARERRARARERHHADRDRPRQCQPLVED